MESLDIAKGIKDVLLLKTIIYDLEDKLCNQDCAECPYEECRRSAEEKDLVEVVRCRECKWWERHQQDGIGWVTQYGRCNLFEVGLADHCYCYYGERKEDKQ